MRGSEGQLTLFPAKFPTTEIPAEFATELRNVNSFTRSKIFKPTFTPRKISDSRQFGFFQQTLVTKNITWSKNIENSITEVPESELWRLGLLDGLLSERASLEKEGNDVKRVVSMLSSLCNT